MTQVRQCSLEESMILTNVSFSPFYSCPKNPVLNEKKLRHVTARYWTIHQVVSEAPGLQNKLKENKYLYTRVKKDFYFLEATWKTSSSSRGNLSPQRKKKSPNSKKHLSLKEITGFLTSKTHDHMPNLHWFACTKLNPKANNRGHQPLKISKEN